MEESAIVTAIRQLAAAFEGDGAVAELAFDIRRIADALEHLSECVFENEHGNSYFNISPEVD
jgi:hypothetical protein